MYMANKDNIIPSNDTVQMSTQTYAGDTGEVSDVTGRGTCTPHQSTISNSALATVSIPGQVKRQ
jgi:hypothetical protein